MFGGETEHVYIGRILQELNSGKSLKNLLLEMRWPERAKLLLKLKTVKKCQEAFLQEVAKD
jgi:hypothetical protein